MFTVIVPQEGESLALSVRREADYVLNFAQSQADRIQQPVEILTDKGELYWVAEPQSWDNPSV